MSTSNQRHVHSPPDLRDSSFPLGHRSHGSLILRASATGEAEGRGTPSGRPLRPELGRWRPRLRAAAGGGPFAGACPGVSPLACLTLTLTVVDAVLDAGSAVRGQEVRAGAVQEPLQRKPQRK